MVGPSHYITLHCTTPQLELRLDSIQILKTTRRVPAVGAECKGIGAWRSVLVALSYLGLASNLFVRRLLYYHTTRLL